MDYLQQETKRLTDYAEKQPMCETHNIEQNGSIPDLMRIVESIDSIFDVIANRAADLRVINDTLFGPEPVPNMDLKSDTPNGAIPLIMERLDALRYMSDQLMPEVKRLKKLV